MPGETAPRRFVVTATPNMHWTARHPFHTNATLSAAFHVQALHPREDEAGSDAHALAPLSKPNRSLHDTSLLSSEGLAAQRAIRGQSFYHLGDTPTLYTAVGRVLAPSAPTDVRLGCSGITCAAIPVGSYEPQWHMHLQHVSPAGAVGIARATGVRRGFGVHWGTWIMSDEPRE